MNKRVLVVDDEDHAIALFRQMFRFPEWVTCGSMMRPLMAEGCRPTGECLKSTHFGHSGSLTR
jgi:hypothetical protein